MHMCPYQNNITTRTYASSKGPIMLQSPAPPAVAQADMRVQYHYVTVDGVRIFYREAGSAANPTIVLLHGFPTSSYMFRNLIPLLAPAYHVIAPDYPGYGNSDMPDRTTFAYTFDHLAELMTGFLEETGRRRFAMYVQDFGAPIGLRIAAAHPTWITGLIVQNGNAYREGVTFDSPQMRAFWNDRNAFAPILPLLETKEVAFQYLHGATNPENISPDTWNSDLAFFARPGAKEIQLDMLHDYANNFPKYAQWQAFFREHQPAALVVWGENDPFFSMAGAQAYKRDLKNIEYHFFPTGHFALEEFGPQIAAYINAFKGKLSK